MASIRLIPAATPASDDILKTEVGWCEPLIYTFNDKFEVIDFKLMTRPSEPSKSHFPEYKLSV